MFIRHLTFDQCMDEAEFKETLLSPQLEKLTKEDIEKRIIKTEFFLQSNDLCEKGLICRITLDNGFVVADESIYVSPKIYDEELWQKMTYDHAFKQLWPLFRFLRVENHKLQQEQAEKEDK